MFQNGIEQRFQEYAPDYMKGGDENRVTAEVPLSTIKHTPIYMYVATGDIFCPMEQALWTADEIGDAVKEVRLFDGQDHGYFTYSLDMVLMESLVHTLGQRENPL